MPTYCTTQAATATWEDEPRNRVWKLASVHGSFGSLDLINKLN
jgi:hypothetical protein